MIESGNETVLRMNGLVFGVLIMFAGVVIYYVTGKLNIRHTKPVVIGEIEDLETA
jgi:hypothetical protein